MKIRIPSPVFILLHITLKCNRNCSWCYQKQDFFYQRHSGDMQPEAFERIISGLKRRFFLRAHIHLFGGEPLSHPQFPEFLKICGKYNYAPTITTNGDYLKQYLGLIKSSSISQLNISLNRPSYPSLEEIYEPLVTSINSLTGGKIINLNFALTPGDYHLLEKVALFFSKKFKKGVVNSFTWQHFIPQAQPFSAKNEAINVSILAEQIKKLQREKINFKLFSLPHIALKDLRKYYHSAYRFRNKCYVPWFGLNIYPDLSVTPGAGILACNKILGNLNRESLQEVWGGKTMAAFRNSLLYRGPGTECNRCCHKLYY
ncbi:MAG: radical SAM protein [Candidatus Omnitrophota bacterium]